MAQSAASIIGVPKPGKRYEPKRPTRDEFELEELANQLIEAKEEDRKVQLVVFGQETVRGTISKLDPRTRLVHVNDYYGDPIKVPFLDILRVESPGY